MGEKRKYINIFGSFMEPFNWMAAWKNQISQYIFFSQWCSISDVLFTGGRGVSDFSVL